jgi:hypothetical protein
VSQEGCVLSTRTRTFVDIAESFAHAVLVICVPGTARVHRRDAPLDQIRSEPPMKTIRQKRPKRARISWVLVVLGCVACGDSHRSRADKPVPIPECEQYERALAACFHRETSFSAHPSVTPTDPAERTQAAKLCADSLNRLKTSCR